MYFVYQSDWNAIVTEVLRYVKGIHKHFLMFRLDMVTVAIKRATMIIIKRRLPTLTHSEGKKPERPIAQPYGWPLE